MEDLEKLKNTIEGMSKTHHIEILKILKKNQNVKLNENKNGVYINITFLPEEIINEISNYVNYIKDQENTLQTMETQKDDLIRVLNDIDYSK